MDRGVWWATVHGFARVKHNLATKPLPPPSPPSYRQYDQLAQLHSLPPISYVSTFAILFSLHGSLVY